MEQKAVVYKNLKGMARDMAVSNGNNEYSYENYNIRITTRGNEDSLVVTNEKGTESNIIASRDVTKVVNTIFEGKKPDFFQSYEDVTSHYTDYRYSELYKYANNSQTSIDVNYIPITEKEYATGEDDNGNLLNFYIPATSKQNVILSTNDGDIVFGYNTEYLVSNDNANNEIKIKGTFTLNEEPTKYLDEDIYLINDGTYSKDIELSIPAGRNNILKRISISDIALGIEDNLSSPLESYQTLYNRLIERKFDFYGFATSVHGFTTTIAENLQRIYQSINNTYDKSYPVGKYEQNEYYAEGILAENNTTSGGVDTESTTNYFRLSTELPKLSFLNGPILADGYANGSSLTLISGGTCDVRLPIIRDIAEGETVSDDEKIYVWGSDSESNADIDYIGTYGEVKNSASRYNNGFHLLAGYIEAKFNEDIVNHKGTIKAISLAAKNLDGTTLYAGMNTSNFEFSITDGNPKTLQFRVVGPMSQTWKYKHNNWFLRKDNISSGEHHYVISTLNVAGYYDLGFKAVESWPEDFDVVENFRAGIFGKYKAFSPDSTIVYTFDDVYKFDGFDGTTPYSKECNNQYYLSNDTSVISGKKYYTRSGSGTEQSPYVYTQVETPTGNPHTSNYYNRTVVKTYNGLQFFINSDTIPNFCTEFKLLTHPTTNKGISTITSRKADVSSISHYYLDIVLGGNTTLTYESGTNKITNSSTTYYMYKLVSDAFEQPFIFYTTADLNEYDFEHSENHYVLVYRFNNGTIDQLATFEQPIIKKDLSEEVLPCDGSYFRIIKDDDKLKFKSSNGSYEFVGNYTITPLNILPIFDAGLTGTTKIKSDFRQVYTNPGFNDVVNNELFKFYQGKFTATFTTADKAFRVKYSNDDWDNEFIYQKLDSIEDNYDYVKDGVYPYYYIDTIGLNFIVENNNDLVGKFVIEKINDNDIFFNGNIADNQIYITVKDKKGGNSDYVYRDTLNNFIEGILDNDVKNDLYTAHEFYVSEITSYNSVPTGLTKSKIEQEVKTIYPTKEIESNYNSKISYEILTDNNQKKYLRQIYESDGIAQTSTIEYDFNSASIKNQFFSILNFSLKVSCFGEYHALTIPGRILGSCTIEEYVVLFFHYSSPALKYYKLEDGKYVYVDDATGINKLYTRRKGTKEEYDLAAENGILLKDDNNDYINGKNRDYIVRLKYIDARPDNKENEWVTIVGKVANVATQPTLLSEITEKKPYYAAEILWNGDLGFNANNGIETIGYYESKDVIKVYWTDGRNQPRMMNIMTPRDLRNGNNCVWDNKTFDFVQEIKGSEKCKIKKQFGGGAFPSGSVQYYFTYSNKGGCETNPFCISPIYYTSQSDKGNSPIKITDNTFKITLYNLSKRFEYVNIYSVVRSTQNSQPYCKKVISLSMKNHNKTITFTDNNLIGETIDHTYLLMLQGTPVSALTFAEKDNTLFLGNINKLTGNMTPDEKEKLKSCFSVTQKSRRYQKYNPDEDKWYENLVNDNKISLEKNSTEIKTFMYNEYYRLGIQLQDKFGKWTDPVFVEDIKCDLPISNRIKYEVEQEDGEKKVTDLQSFIPYFSLRIEDGMQDTFNEIINKYEYKRIRPVIVYPNISSRNVLCQGLLSPTMFNYADRSVNGPFNFSSYFFRPYPPAISGSKDESGNYKFDVDVNVLKGGGYPVEYRHGYPITGYHDAVEESLAQGNIMGSGEDGVAKLVNKYLSKRDVKSVQLTSNTPGWWIGGATYFREGTISFDSNGVPTFKSGGKIYKVSESTNKGNLNYAYSLEEDKRFVKVENSSTSEAFTNAIFNMLGFGIASSVNNGTGISKNNSYRNALGFSSHMHYFKNKLLNLASMFLTADVITTTYQLADMVATGDVIIKKIAGPDFAFAEDSVIFNEGDVYYRAYYPLDIKILPLSEVSKRKHRGLKRKTYYCDITVKSYNKIELSTSENGSKYIDDGGAETEVAQKAYFAYNNGEIACANGNKSYNIFAGSNIEKVNESYNSSEINIAGRKQSLFYVDESVCTLNSPDIEYNPTIQKIDLSNYRLNIIGAANITGYKNKIDINYETPPAILGSIVAQGFRHEPFEIQNFNTEAYRYMLSGAYWYDSYFNEGSEGESEAYKNDSGLLSDQYCWWVYPFNRQILNNSHDGAYGKCRTKKWVNYHYSAFSDYFGKASVIYELDDAKQIYDEYQAVNLDTVWMKDKATYFGSCDTAYTNPVPLVGILGGSNAIDENAYEQSLAVSPHSKFKAGSDSYSSANLADIVPFTFASSNHFVLSLQAEDGKANVFPKYYTQESILPETQKTITSIPIEESYEFDCQGYIYRSSQNPVAFFGPAKDGDFLMHCDDNTEVDIYLRKLMGVTDGKYYRIIDANGQEIAKWGTDVPVELSDSQSGLIYDENDNLISVKFKKTIIYDESFGDAYHDFEYHNNYATLERTYNIPGSLIDNDLVPPTSCIEKYIQYDDVVENNNVKRTGIYDYGHVYIAQLERNVNGPDDVFSGTEESVLLQNTWLPAGEALMISEFKSNGLKYTEGDTYYQRYDCMKTYAHSSSDVNQNVEVLSAMIQTRLNLDGIYSLRGSVDNVDMNDSNTNLLNQAYTQDDNYFSYTITDPYISNITEYSNMFTWTLTKQIMSSKDNWTAINLISFYNATGSFGKITRLINYRNDIFCFQNNAISKILYNERVALTPSDGVPIEIGNSGKVQGLGYISSNVGCQNRWSVVPSKGFLYWVDDRRAEIYRFGEGLEPFSTAKGFSDWVKANTYGEDWKPIKSTNVPITAYYDNNNDDIYFVTEKDCLAYNEKIDAFESFFSYEDSFILNSAGNTIVIKEQDTLITDNTDIYSGESVWNNGIRGDGLSSIELMHEGEYNRFFGVQMPFYVRFKVYPTDMQRDKIYTNLEFNIDAFDEKNIYLPDETFTRVRIWDEYQWGQMYLTTNPYGTTNYKRRFRNHYLQLPRASYYPVYNVYEDYNNLYQRELVWRTIPSSGEMPIPFLSNSSSNDRIRNPWVWMEMYKENKAFVPEVFDLTNIQGDTIEEKREAYYLANKNHLFLRRFSEVSSDDFNQYETLYKKILIGGVGYIVIDIDNATTFNAYKSILYIKNNDNTYSSASSLTFDAMQTYYYNAGYVVEENGDRLATATIVNDRENYPIESLWYRSKNGEYEATDGFKYSKAGQDHYDNTNVDLYNLQYNTLYKEEYIYCANNFNFASDAIYFKLKNSNCRVEIHDIIVKYFEA